MAKGNAGSGGRGGRHALGYQQPTGKDARSTAGRGKGLFSRSTGKHAGGRGNNRGSDGGTKGGAAGGLDRWG